MHDLSVLHKLRFDYKINPIKFRGFKIDSEIEYLDLRLKPLAKHFDFCECRKCYQESNLKAVQNVLKEMTLVKKREILDIKIFNLEFEFFFEDFCDNWKIGFLAQIEFAYAGMKILTCLRNKSEVPKSYKLSESSNLLLHLFDLKYEFFKDDWNLDNFMIQYM
jgi:hypothetical protein